MISDSEVEHYRACIKLTGSHERQTIKASTLESFILKIDYLNSVIHKLQNNEVVWIDVKDKLPTEIGYYQVKVSDVCEMGTRCDIAFYAIKHFGTMAMNTRWGTFLLYDWAGGEVTHWAKLLPNECGAKIGY